MAQRTYLIGLYLAMNTLYNYMSRWQLKIEANMTDPQKVCFQAVLDAVIECLPLIQPPPPVT